MLSAMHYCNSILPARYYSGEIAGGKRYGCNLDTATVGNVSKHQSETKTPMTTAPSHHWRTRTPVFTPSSNTILLFQYIAYHGV